MRQEPRQSTSKSEREAVIPEFDFDEKIKHF